MGKEAIKFITELFPLKKKADVTDFINWGERYAVPEEIEENPNVLNRRNIYRYKLDRFEILR
jgi:hypothetical protein